jgi:hypothetical protein
MGFCFFSFPIPPETEAKYSRTASFILPEIIYHTQLEMNRSIIHEINRNDFKVSFISRQRKVPAAAAKIKFHRFTDVSKRMNNYRKRGLGIFCKSESIEISDSDSDALLPNLSVLNFTVEASRN